jgi:hypothetical protein
MSRIMRELAEEGRKAREAAKRRDADEYVVTGVDPATPDSAVTLGVEDEPWPFIYHPTADTEYVCSHGIDMSQACYACGRFAQKANP